MLALTQLILAAEATTSGSQYLISGLIGVIVGAVIGGLIGRSKGRGGLGVILGGLLGCIGWIIILLIPRRDRY